jgi:hypothetical protein
MAGRVVVIDLRRHARLAVGDLVVRCVGGDAIERVAVVAERQCVRQLRHRSLFIERTDRDLAHETDESRVSSRADSRVEDDRDAAFVRCLDEALESSPRIGSSKVPGVSGDERRKGPTWSS